LNSEKATDTETDFFNRISYKLSVSVNRRHKLIRCVKVSDASEADTRHLVEVLDRGNSGRDFWADRGYHDKPRERWLKLIGWRPQIQLKGQAGKPIEERDKARNKRIASPWLGSNMSLPASPRWAARGSGALA
jgi:IS5 family transposase